MKKMIFALSVLTSLTAFADSSYTCRAKDDAVDVGLPEMLFVTIEGATITLQDAKTDIYYGGKLGQGGLRATGFPNLILDTNGYVLISKNMKRERKRASLTIHDDALDSVDNQYSCIKD